MFILYVLLTFLMYTLCVILTFSMYIVHVYLIIPIIIYSLHPCDTPADYPPEGPLSNCHEWHTSYPKPRTPHTRFPRIPRLLPRSRPRKTPNGDCGTSARVYKEGRSGKDTRAAYQGREIDKVSGERERWEPSE